MYWHPGAFVGPVNYAVTAHKVLVEEVVRLNYIIMLFFSGLILCTVGWSAEYIRDFTTWH